MKNFIILIISILFITYCQIPTAKVVKPEEDIDTLIAKHKDKIFLDFWYGMSKEQYKLVESRLLEQNIISRSISPSYISNKNDTFAEFYFENLYECNLKLKPIFDYSSGLTEIHLQYVDFRATSNYLSDKYPNISIPTSNFITKTNFEKIIKIYESKYAKPISILKTVSTRPDDFGLEFESDWDIGRGSTYFWMVKDKLIRISARSAEKYQKHIVFKNLPKDVTYNTKVNYYESLKEFDTIYSDFKISYLSYTAYTYRQQNNKERKDNEALRQKEIKELKSNKF